MFTSGGFVAIFKIEHDDTFWKKRFLYIYEKRFLLLFIIAHLRIFYIIMNYVDYNFSQLIIIYEP